MKRLNDLIGKDKRVDLAKVFKPDGKVDEEALEVLETQKPIVPPIAVEKKMKFSVKVNRDRYADISTFPDELPTFGLLPLPPDEHEHIGLYETKQNLYLLFAHAYNKVMARLDKLEAEIEALKIGNQPK